MLWAITCHFNPCGYRSRVRNYQHFRAHLQVPLVTVELAFGEQFELRSGDAEVLVQVRGGDVLWQKERLLNRALAELPPACTAVAWLDADVLLHNDSWPEQALRRLEDFAFLQPFSAAADLPPHSAPTRAHRLPVQSHAAAWHLAQGTLPAGYFARRGNSERCGIAPGKAWVGRRELLDRHGFYDRFVIGSGDRLLFNAMVSELTGAVHAYGMNPAQAIHYQAWAAPFARDAADGVGVVAGRLTHLWHGALARRSYADRHAEFAQFGFDPARDVAVGPGGCLAWSTHRPAMHAWVRRYFEARREDDAEARRPRPTAGRPAPGREP